VIRSTSAVFTGQLFNLADQEEGSSSSAMQGKESPVGSNTQETHQYVGPYRLEKTLGKGQTGGWCSFSFPFPFTPSLLQISVAIVITIDDSHRNVSSSSKCLIKFRVFESIYEISCVRIFSDRTFNTFLIGKTK